VTPAAAVYEGKVDYASIPAWDGQIGVMAGQSPLLTRLGIGAARLHAAPTDTDAGGDRWFLLEGGFAQVNHDQLTLLTERAIPAERLSLREAEAELAEANARVVQSGEDRAKVERDQQRAMAKVTLARIIEQRGGAI
jgi:F-type H+-transporting ATPase subunit epsilon